MYLIVIQKKENPPMHQVTRGSEKSINVSILIDSLIDKKIV